MSLRLRRQFPEFEINEITDEKSVSVDEAIKELKTFDWTGENQKSTELVEEHAEPAIIIQNTIGDKLYIYSEDGKKFGVTLTKSAFIPRSSISTIGTFEYLVDIVKLLDSGERSVLMRKLESSEYHYKMSFIIDVITRIASKDKIRNSREVVKQDYSYKIKMSSLARRLFWSSIFLFMAPVITLYAVIIEGKDFHMVAFLWIQLVTSPFALPGIIITINHWRKNGHWTVYFQKGTNTFFILTPTKKEVFDKKDFEKRVRTENVSHAPWNWYEYTTLVAKDGRQLHFSNLLIPSSDMDKLFGRIEETIDKRGFQIIKDKQIKADNKMHMR